MRYLKNSKALRFPKPKNKARLLGQSGQMTIEIILITTLFVAIFMAASGQMRQQQLLAKLVQSPWSYLAGMIENGIWAPAEIGKNLHSNHLDRHGSPRGDTL